MALPRIASNYFNKSSSELENELLSDSGEETQPSQENGVSTIDRMPQILSAPASPFIPSVKTTPSSGKTRLHHKQPENWRNKLTQFLKKCPKLLLATVSASPASVNAAAAATNSDTKDIGITWWQAMSDQEKAFSLWNAIASLIVNIKLNVDYLPVALEKTKDAIATSCDSAKQFVLTASTMSVGLSAAVAAGAIAYASFSWAGALVAGTITGVNSIIFYATRYVGFKNLINRIVGMLNKDIRFTKEIINSLERIENNQLHLVNHIIDKETHQHKKGLSNPLTLNRIFIQLNALSEQMAQQGNALIRPQTRLDRIQDYSGTIFDVLLATITAMFIFPTFAQKGFDGFKQLSQLLGRDISDLDRNIQLGIGFVPGSASAAMYAMSALDFRKIAWLVFQEVSAHPKQKLPDLIAVLFWVITNYFASASMENIARKGIIARQAEEQLIPFAPGSTTSEVYAIFNRIGGFLVNTKSSLADSYGTEATLPGLIKQLRKIDVDTLKKEEWNQLITTAGHLSLFTGLQSNESGPIGHHDYQALPREPSMAIQDKTQTR